MAIGLYNFPPGLAKTGTAARLDVPASIIAVPKRLKKSGYSIGRAPLEMDELLVKLEAFAKGESSHALTNTQYRALFRSCILYPSHAAAERQRVHVGEDREFRN